MRLRVKGPTQAASVNRGQHPPRSSHLRRHHRAEVIVCREVRGACRREDDAEDVRRRGAMRPPHVRERAQGVGRETQRAERAQHDGGLSWDWEPLDCGHRDLHFLAAADEALGVGALSGQDGCASEVRGAERQLRGRGRSVTARPAADRPSGQGGATRDESLRCCSVHICKTPARLLGNGRLRLVGKKTLRKV